MDDHREIYRRALLLIAAFLLLNTVHVPAQTSDWASNVRTVVGGTAIQSATEPYHVQGTIGQPAIGVHVGATTQLESGFWHRLPSVAGTTLTTGSTLQKQLLPILHVSPNPCTNQAQISIHLQQEELISLQLFNIHGQLVQTLLHNSKQLSGAVEFTMQTNDLPAGHYNLVCRTNTGQHYIEPITLVR